MPPAARLTAQARYAVWPEHWDAVLIFEAMQTQWRWIAGFGGAARTGLDYAALRSIPRYRRLPADQEDPVFAQLQVLEDEALVIFARRAE